MLKRKAKEDSDITNKLGFSIGDAVRISRRYFSNHKAPYIDLGIGTIESKALGDTHTLPTLKVRFPFHRAFYTEPILKLILDTSNAHGGTISVTVDIHPVYLEQAKGKKKNASKA